MSTSSLERASASIRRVCCSSTFGSLKRFWLASSSSSSVGHRAPDEERETRGQLEIGDAVDARRRRRRCGLFLDAIQELRIREQSRDALLDAALEVLPLAADVIELHQRVDGRIVRRHRAAKGARCELRENLARTRRFARCVRRPAREDRAAARRIAGSTGVERTVDDDVLEIVAPVVDPGVQIVDTAPVRGCSTRAIAMVCGPAGSLDPETPQVRRLHLLTVDRDIEQRIGRSADRRSESPCRPRSGIRIRHRAESCG